MGLTPDPEGGLATTEEQALLVCTWLGLSSEGGLVTVGDDVLRCIFLGLFLGLR